MQWNETDEDAAFDRNGSMVIAHFNSAAIGNGWFPYSSSPAANGTVPNSHKTVVTGMTEFSPYAVANDGPLPVELASFTSMLNARDLKLTWSTNHESNNSGFDIERALKTKTDSTWKKVGHINGAGTTNTIHNYNFDDKKLDAGKYSYRLKQIDYNGNFKYFDLANEVVIGVPDKYSISQNYPNPFNPATKIDYNLPVDSKVQIKLYDIAGREVANIINTTQLAGYYTVLFNASNLASGTYFYNIIAEGSKDKFVMTKKMTLIK